MNRIVHLALKVDDIDKAGAFYQNVFGFVDTRPPLAPHERRRH